jgi:hypothetical protein
MCTINAMTFRAPHCPLSAILQTGVFVFQVWSILTVYDIYRIFHELQRSFARLQHRYYDVTILMG